MFFSAAHCRENAPSTPDGKYILHSQLVGTSILMVLSSAGIFQRANCSPYLRWRLEAGWQLPDHKTFAMKPGNLLLIHSTPREIFNQISSVTISKRTSTLQTNTRITAASNRPAISESIFLPFILSHDNEGTASFQYHFPYKYFSKIKLSREI